MRIAIGIVSLFPGGGLQRDCIEIAKMMRHARQDVVIYTARLTGALDIADIPIVVVPNDAKTNHERQQIFAVEFLRQVSNDFDLIVGFDKLLGLDVLYCADQSIRYRLHRQPYLRLLARYRTYHNLEADTFKPTQKTRILVLTKKQSIEYASVWHVEAERVTELPPTLARARCKPHYRVNGVRDQVRAELGVAGNAWVWVAIGVQPWTKGLDRVMHALKLYRQATLLVAGLKDTDSAARTVAETARWLGIWPRIIWLGHREDVERIIAASDVLLHPARYDTTGTVILEAIVNGLPVITTSACGYAMHVKAAGAGIVLEEPFDVPVFLTAINDMRNQAHHAVYSNAGIAYGRSRNLYEGRVLAAKMIMDFAEQKRHVGQELRHPQELPLEAKVADTVVSLPLISRK